MSTNPYITAIDIGTTKIVALAGRMNERGQMEVMGVGKSLSRGVKRGVVTNIEETTAAIQEAVTIAEQKSGITFSNVFVGIAGMHIKSVRNRGYKYIENPDDEITQADVDELTQDMFKIPIEAGHEIIHVIPQTYTVDNEAGVLNPVGMSGKRLEANFHIVIGEVQSARNLKRCVDRLNMTVKALILEPLASAAAVLTEDEKEAGVALVDIGGGTTDIAVFYDGIVRHTAVIPFGGNVITTDIKEGCAILHRQAEQLKIQYGLALGDVAPDNRVVIIQGINGRDSKEISVKSLAYIIQARMEEIIDTVMFEIENSGYADKLGAGIAITGGGSMLQYLPQLMKFRFGTDVCLSYPKAVFTGNAHDEGALPIYSTGIGLLIKGHDILNDERLRGRAEITFEIDDKLFEKRPIRVIPNEPEEVKPELKAFVEAEKKLEQSLHEEEPLQPMVSVQKTPPTVKQQPPVEEKTPQYSYDDEDLDDEENISNKDKKPASGKKESLLSALRSTFKDIFDDRDTKM